ncbi:hypothetical protein HDU96_007443 [Phlyctochytrium bullatum]|nr:hypothetical protein HDU96_007443 [Phlyctochytrium bullatum]
MDRILASVQRKRSSSTFYDFDMMPDNSNGEYALPANNPRELGAVQFQRNLDVALGMGKPVFLQFQEIPGCGTCISYGDTVLSPPLMVEFLETLFTPCAIRNNASPTSTDPRSIEDFRVLRLFGEPAWNNPVARVLAAETVPPEDLVERIDGHYALAPVLRALFEALLALPTPPPLPPWVDLLAVSASFRLYRGPTLSLRAFAPLDPATATFTMGCYWQGEARLAAPTGVLATTPGFCAGAEAVLVSFDPAMLPFVALAAIARTAGFTVLAHDSQQLAEARRAGAIAKDRRTPDGSGTLRPFRAAEPAEVKHFLRRVMPDVACLPLTALQQAKLNAIAARSTPPADEVRGWLSPRQVGLLERVKRCGGARALGLQMSCVVDGDDEGGICVAQMRELVEALGRAESCVER